MFFFIFVRYSLIKKNAPTVAIVPSKWVQNCSNMYFCFWLPQKFQVTKMIKSGVLPDEETWLQYPCEILKTFGLLI